MRALARHQLCPWRASRLPRPKRAQSITPSSSRSSPVPSPICTVEGCAAAAASGSTSIPSVADAKPGASMSASWGTASSCVPCSITSTGSRRPQRISSTRHSLSTTHPPTRAAHRAPADRAVFEQQALAGGPGASGDVLPGHLSRRPGSSSGGVAPRAPPLHGAAQRCGRRTSPRSPGLLAQRPAPPSHPLGLKVAADCQPPPTNR